MATYVNDLRLKEIGTGESSGTWGTETNVNLELIGEALSFGTESITTNADTHTSTVADGSTDPARSMYIKYTGTLDSACTITIAPNTLSRLHFIENGTSGSQNIIISQGSGANVTIPPGDVKVVYLDGAGSGAAVVDAFASLNVVDLKVEDDLTVTDDVSIGGALTLTGNADFNGDLDVDGTTNLDVVDIDGAVDMASTLQVDGAITSSSGATITTTGNTAQLQLISTDADAGSGPQLDLYRNSSSPADNDEIGRIYFYGENDADEKIEYGLIRGTIVDASDSSEDSAMQFYTYSGGGQRNRIDLIPDETVFNEGSHDIDFRVESNSNTHMLFVDAGNDRIGINDSAPQKTLDIFDSTLPVIRLTNGQNQGTGSDYDLGKIEFFSDDSSGTGARVLTEINAIADAASTAPGGIFVIKTAVTNSAAVERVRFDAGHEVIFNETGTDTDFRVESNNNANMLFVDGGNDVVCVGGTTVETGDHFEVLSSDTTTNLRIRNTNAGSAAPALIFDKASSSPADSDEVGLLNFIGLDDASSATVYAQIVGKSDDVSNGTEDGSLTFGHVKAGTFVNQMQLTNGRLQINVNNNDYNLQVYATSTNSFFGIRDDANDSVILQMDRSDGFTAFTVNAHTAACTIGGALSKGSGSFKIDHPLESKKDTHHLVHSFIEGPQADLIYRGKVALSGGSASVNIDTASDMTDGTFVALCRDVQCYTSNETGWTAVKGAVSGNTLTITAQDNSCTDTISWMVVGERQDPHMKDSLTEWTDSDGKIIVEPAKEA
jgi:hypothetical protein